MQPYRLVATATVLTAMLGISVAHLAVMSIDLGSEFIKIALVKPGIPMEIITNDDSARKTANIVCLRNGDRMFGNPAEHCASKYPSNAFWYLTQIVGKMHDDPAVTQYQKRFPYYQLVKDKERGTTLFKINDETQYSPEELLAMILEKARQYAETFADQPIKDVVITVPSYFNQAERRAVLMAAELGGLNVLQLIGDNAAVALNYGVFRRKQFSNVTQHIMFYDMGASSTTATIVAYQVVKMKEGSRVVENPQLTIKGVGFDKELGGLEISMRLRDHLAKYFNKNKKTKADLYTNHRAMTKLLREAEHVKKILSANVDHMAQVEGLLEEEDFKMKVSREELEKMCDDMFPRVTRVIDDALKTSELTREEISDVILMGGGTRIPKVQTLLQEYLGGVELGKSINTDEAAALGAVYQAANLGKGFKVLTFGIKEANMYPIVVEFEKQRGEDSSTEASKVIKRTLFGRMNPYPQKKVMTFNKHFKDFTFNVTYGDLDFLPAAEAEVMRNLQGQINEISLRGVAEAYAKHTDAQEAKGIKAHFRMDESGILNLDLVETVFEKEDDEKSTWSKLGDTLSGLFGSTEGNDTADSQEPVGGGNGEPEKTKSDQSESGNEEEKFSKEKEEQKEEQPAEENADEDKTDNQKEESDKGDDKEKEQTEKPKEDKKKKDDKNGDKKDEEKKDDGEKKPKVVLVKENITTEASVNDIKPPSKEALRAMKKKLADLTARDNDRKALEKAKNELEAFVYEMTDRLSQKTYEKCSTEEEREKLRTMLQEASDWLYEVEEGTPKEKYIEKLKGLKKAMKELEFRVKEMKERPEAIAALNSMLNHSKVFLASIKNISSMEPEDAMFSAVEIETLEKLINETEDWKKTSVAEQKKIPAHEKPKLVLEDISLKMQALDREVKYLINKAKTWKPKSKPKASKTNKTTSNNDTVPEADDIAGEKTEDIPAEDETAEEVKEQKEEKSSKKQKDKTTKASEEPEVTLELPPADESQTAKEETTTQKPKDKVTHDAGDL